MKSVLFVAVGFLILTVGFQQDLGHKLPDDKFARLLFLFLDNDNDTKIEFDELNSFFSIVDQNGDGVIPEKELLSVWMSMGFGNANHAVFLFKHADTDHDGVVDKVDIRRLYDYFDSNGDGKIDIAEFVTTWIKMTS